MSATKPGEFLRCQHAERATPDQAERGGFSCYVIMEGERVFAGIGLCTECMQALRDTLDREPFSVVPR